MKAESIQDTDLTVTEFRLPGTTNNIANKPTIGDKIQITFYITKSEDTESVQFSKSGTQYTQKKFALIDIVAISSGFISTQSLSALLTISNMNQPVSKARYRIFYDYTAPKVNERITIRYNYDKLITDITNAIEKVRITGADVLVKSATAIYVDCTMYVVVSTAMINSAELVIQNVQNTITNTINAQTLGTTLDQSDLINAAYSVTGVDRVRILYFNEDGETGSVLSVVAANNEYIVANDIRVTQESR